MIQITELWVPHGPDKEPTGCEYVDCNRLAKWYKPGGDVQFTCDEHCPAERWAECD